MDHLDGIRWCFVRVLLGTAAGVALSSSAFCQPQPGDVFREYCWTNQGGDAGGSLRVGGKVGYDGGAIKFTGPIDLQHAVRAEVVLEKLLCHAGTRGLEISINGHPWIAVPESDSIPQPQWDYQHHTYPVVPIPLEQCKADGDNQFRLRVAEQHPWNWPQHLIYGVHLRLYYDPAAKSHPSAELQVPAGNARVGRQITLQLNVHPDSTPVARVDYLGLYEGVNLEGDGEYRQWHYHYVRGKLSGHIGTATTPPWDLLWDTRWIPDQPEPFALAARVTDIDGIIFQTPAVSGLTFDRQGLRVELCRPYDVPAQWVTRSGEHEEKFQVRGNLSQAVAAQLVWCSWSPGYMEGIYVNNTLILRQEGPRYAYFVHRVPLSDVSVLKVGENTLKTGKTPKHNGQMVHGMEVNWPGVMVLIQYQE